MHFPTGERATQLVTAALLEGKQVLGTLRNRLLPAPCALRTLRQLPRFNQSPICSARRRAASPNRAGPRHVSLE
jgi:hypothetical protein